MRAVDRAPSSAVESPLVAIERALRIVALLFITVLCGTPSGRVLAAEATTGILSGTVTTRQNVPLANAPVTAASASGRYTTRTGSDGRFTIVGIAPDTYTISIEVTGYEPAVREGVTVLPAVRTQLAFRLDAHLRTIGTVRASANAFPVGSTADTFTVNGEAARAQSPSETASGLANFTAGTVQGAVANVPGIDLDSFANVIPRGGKVDETVFNYDSIPIPQGLVAEPGGNIVGAQLFTTGIASTNVTLAGYTNQVENALGGVVDQIPAVGTYPARTSITFTDGALALDQELATLAQFASPDLRFRGAIATTFASQYFPYGDSKTFYPSEVATYGLALQARGQSSGSANVHYRLGSSDDLALEAFYGEASYQQYDSPYAGETIGAFDGAVTPFPGETAPNAAASASGLRGDYDVLKAQWLHASAHATTRLQLYQTQFGSAAGGPFWDDLSFPDGPISLSSRQGGRETGFVADITNVASSRDQVIYGAEYRVNASFLDQAVPTAGEVIASHPTLFTRLAYLGDTWTVTPRFDLSATARLLAVHIVPSDGAPYGVGATDPHLAAAYRLGDQYAVRATYDHNTLAPQPLEADRTDTANPAPFVPLAPEIGNDYTVSFEGGGRTQFRATYFAKAEFNQIDVLPSDFRSAISSDESPSGVGVPTNAGNLLAHGLELWAKSGGATVDLNYVRAYSSSASQFSFNDLNAAAIAAGALFPVSYVPDLTGTFSYEFHAGRHVRITPLVSFESGYPYGNGKMVYTFDPVTGKPEQVPNDNHVNPGYNYYFLADPSQPYNAQSNPYIGSLGTPESSDPNSLRTPPQTLVSLHIEGDITPRLTAMIDVTNLFGDFSPTQEQGNPYSIGPPGYAGGNPAYAAWYEQQVGGSAPYTLGNGTPTSDGVNAALPWTYGRAGYVPQAYPMGRTIQFRLRYRL